MSNGFWKGAPNSFVEMGELNKERITMEVIPFKLARDIISKHHYTHTLNRANICLGFYIDGKLNTVMVYGRASISHDKMLNSLPGDYFELVRLFSFDWAGKNMESYCIGMAMKHIQKNYSDIKVLISFTKALVIPLLVLIQRLSKKTIVITNCKTITGTATINRAR